MSKELLAQSRISAGLSQTEAAARLGISRETFNRWETGKDKIPAKRLSEFLTLVASELEARAATRSAVEASLKVLSPKPQVSARPRSPEPPRPAYFDRHEDPANYEEDGTCYDEERGRWYARICTNGSRVPVAIAYKTREEAALAHQYNIAKEEINRTPGALEEVREAVGGYGDDKKQAVVDYWNARGMV